MARLRAVILDVDGTLVDSNDAHARSFVDAAAELGHEGVRFEEVRRLIGMGGDKLIPRVFGFDKETPEGEEVSRRKTEIFQGRYLPALQPTPGARALLEALKERGLRLVVATSAKQEDLQGLLRRAGVEELVDDSTSASEVEESKPDPDVVASALDKAGCAADEAWMLGDTPYDVEAAARAGLRIVGVRTGGWDDADLRGAVAVFDDPADVLRNLDRLPGLEQSR